MMSPADLFVSTAHAAETVPDFSSLPSWASAVGAIIVAVGTALIYLRGLKDKQAQPVSHTQFFMDGPIGQGLKSLQDIAEHVKKLPTSDQQMIAMTERLNAGLSANRQLVYTVRDNAAERMTAMERDVAILKDRDQRRRSPGG